MEVPREAPIALMFNDVVKRDSNSMVKLRGKIEMPGMCDAGSDL